MSHDLSPARLKNRLNKNVIARFIQQMKNLIIFLIVLSCTLQGNAQTAPFQIAIEPVNISGLEGLQSFAYGRHNGKWLLMGGRLDGLHRRRPYYRFLFDRGKNTRCDQCHYQRNTIYYVFQAYSR
jgi:hypothetical protein